jgi:hypothetical protein
VAVDKAAEGSTGRLEGGAKEVEVLEVDAGRDIINKAEEMRDAPPLPSSPESPDARRAAARE